MSDATDNAGRAEGSSADGASIAELLDAPSWEERVAAAREKREKVLARKAQGKNDAASEEDLSAAVAAPLPPVPPVAQPDMQHPESQTPEDGDATAEKVVALAPAAAATVAAASVPAATKSSEKRGLKSAALLLVACCGALGFGIALGAGIVMNMQSERPAQANDVAGAKTQGTAAEAVATAPIATTPAATTPIATGAAEASEADTALAAASTPIEELVEGIETVSASTASASTARLPAPSPAERIADTGVIIPQQGPNLDDMPGAPYDVELVKYKSDVQPLSPPPPTISSLQEVPSPVQPEGSFDLGIGAWDQAEGALAVAFQAAQTETSQAVSPKSQASLALPPGVDASDVTARLDVAPQIDLTGADFEVSVAPPAVNLKAPEDALAALSTDLVWASVNSSTALNAPGLAAPAAPNVALLPPEVDTWNGVPIRPTARPTLASNLGYVGAELDAVNLVLHAPGGIEPDALDAEAQRVRGTGFVLSRMVRPQFKVSKSHLRFYNEADRELASAIADEMGFALRDFSSTNARAGLIEVWLEGGPSATAPQPSARPRAARPNRQRSAPRSQSRPRSTNRLDQLRNNLANRLRNGDHL